MRTVVVAVCIFAGLGLGIGCASATRSKALVVRAGASIPRTGMTIDASYDSSLDGVVPGYKILNVAITNSSLNVVGLDAILDRWWVEDARRRRSKAILDLNRYDPDVWSRLPARLKELLAYPLMVPTGGTVNIDLLFPEQVELSGFRALIFESSFFGARYRIVTRHD